MPPAKIKYDQPIYVISGKDDYLISSKAKKIVNSVLDSDQKDMNLLNCDGDKISAAEVFDELRTLSFNGGKRVVLVKDSDKFITANRPLLESYFDNPSSSGVLILLVNSWKANTKLAKKLNKSQLIEIAQIKGSKLNEFIVQYAKTEHNKSITTNAAYALADLIGDQPGRLASEIDKLAAYDIDKKTIDVEDITSLVTGSKLYDAFNVLDSVSKADVSAAISKLRKMFASDKSAEYSVVGAFAYNFRQMFNAKAMLEKGYNEAQVIKKCRIWANKNEFMQRIRKISLDRIGWMLEELAKIDYQLKTGGSNASIAMEQLIIKCCIINKKALSR